MALCMEPVFLLGLRGIPPCQELESPRRTRQGQTGDDLVLRFVSMPTVECRLAILLAFRLIEVNPQIKLLKARFNDQYPRKSWLKAIGIAVGGVVVGLLVIGIAMAIIAPDTGTITFAEHVDAKTLKTTHEGTSFTTGWVALVVRSTSPFGDSKMIISSQKHGEVMWSIVSEVTVSPEWDVFAKPIALVEPGDYKIRATTSTGKVVATGSVHIVSK